jgi:hypothetical protein
LQSLWRLWPASACSLLAAKRLPNPQQPPKPHRLTRWPPLKLLRLLTLPLRLPMLPLLLLTLPLRLPMQWPLRLPTPLLRKRRSKHRFSDADFFDERAGSATAGPAFSCRPCSSPLFVAVPDVRSIAIHQPIARKCLPAQFFGAGDTRLLTKGRAMA